MKLKLTLTTALPHKQHYLESINKTNATADRMSILLQLICFEPMSIRI